MFWCLFMRVGALLYLEWQRGSNLQHPQMWLFQICQWRLPLRKLCKCIEHDNARFDNVTMSELMVDLRDYVC